MHGPKKFGGKITQAFFSIKHLDLFLLKTTSFQMTLNQISKFLSIGKDV